MKNKQLLSFLLLLVAVVACTETTPIPENQDPPKQEEEASPSKLELISVLWSIDTAYHAGVYDASSTGKNIEFFMNGRYNFNGTLDGNWHFNSDSSKVIIDEGLSYQQDWTIIELSEKRFDASFKSPFTGQMYQPVRHPGYERNRGTRWVCVLMH